MKRIKQEIYKNISLIKNSLDGLNSRLDNVEEKISELKDKTIKTMQTEGQREKKLYKKE